MNPYSIASALILCLTGGFLLGNTWWCLFVSTYDGASLLCWWLISAVVVCVISVISILWLGERADTYAERKNKGNGIQGI